MRKSNALALFMPVALTHMLAPSALAQDMKMGFFVTSVGSGKGADLGGLDGADRGDRCVLGKRLTKASLLVLPRASWDRPGCFLHSSHSSMVWDLETWGHRFRTVAF